MDAESKVADLPPKSDDTNDFKTRCMEKMRKVPCLGILMALFSGICFATAGFTVELMQGTGDEGSKGVDALFIVVCRGFIQSVFYLPAGLFLGDPLTGVPGERSYLFQRALWGFVCFTVSYYALSYISLSDSSAIAFSAPVFVSIFACVLLKEPCGVFQISTVICTLIGVVLIARPSFIFGGDAEDRHFSAADRLIGTSLSFFTALTMAYTFVVIRRLQKTPTTTVVNYFSAFSIVVGVPIILILKYALSLPVRMPAQCDIVYLVINGMCGVFGQLFLVISLKIEQAGLVSLTRTFDIVMAFIYQVACLHQEATLLSIIGAVIVSAGCVACGLKKFLEARPDAFSWFSFPSSGSKKSYDVNANETVKSCSNVTDCNLSAN